MKKIEHYDLTPLKKSFTGFYSVQQGYPFIKASIKSVTLSYAEGKRSYDYHSLHLVTKLVCKHSKTL